MSDKEIILNKINDLISQIQLNNIIYNKSSERKAQMNILVSLKKFINKMDNE